MPPQQKYYTREMHDMLRARLDLIDDETMQIVASEVAGDLQPLDLFRLPPDAVLSPAQVEEARKPLRLTGGARLCNELSRPNSASSHLPLESAMAQHV